MVGKAAKEAMAMIRPPPSLRSHYLTRIRILPPPHIPPSFYTNPFGCELLIKVNPLGFHEWLQVWGRGAEHLHHLETILRRVTVEVIVEVA
jgi:hypothetical protein